VVLAVGVFVFTAAMLVGTAGRGRADTTPTAFSDSRCSPVPNTSFTLSCTAPKSLGPGDKVVYGPLIFQTATNSAATATNLTAVATAKEQAVAKQGKNPPTATVSTSNATPYEVSIDDDVSWGGGGLSVTLATSSQVGKQFSRMPIPGTMPPGFATLTETARRRRRRAPGRRSRPWRPACHP
jgi:hypothetical protein